MRIFLIILALSVTIISGNSCRKNDDALFDGVNCSGNCFILTGKLIDSAANSGISRGEIRFYFVDNSGTFSSKKFYLGRTITDDGGSYTFKFDGSRFAGFRGYFYAEAFKGDMFGDLTYPNRVATFDLDTSFYNVPYIQHFPLFRPATVTVRIIAQNVTSFQYLTIDRSYGKGGSGIVLNGNRRIDTTITWKTAGDIKTYISSDATGNGVNIQKRDTLIIPAHSSRSVEVRF